MAVARRHPLVFLNSLFATMIRIFSPRVLAFCIALALGSVLLLATTPAATADTPAIVVPVTLAPLQRDTPIELVALTLDAQLSESNGRTIITGNSTFKLHNTDKLNDVSQSVGFPAWSGDPYVFDPSRLVSFSPTLEGKRINLASGKSELKIGGSVRTVDWYSFTLTLAADEKKTAKFEFTQDLGDGQLSRFVYGLLPATAWKGSIGSARLSIRFPDATTLEQIIASEPSNPAFDGEGITWNFGTQEPSANPSITIIRPSIWNDLTSRRRAVQQNPNDASAHASLGSLLKQLATTNSTKSDSLASQAIAELETAVRIDPGLRTARQLLGSTYEGRAGPASGPRQPAYVLLAAAQWEPLAASDAVARKQLAEDYFYLGADAQTRGAFEDASSYWDKASSLMPGGAGPLFTPERLAAQRRALNLAWARSLLDKGDYANAIAPARAALGDSFMNSVTPPSFFVSRTQVVMTDNQRTMTFRLVSFSKGSAELQKNVKAVLAAANTSGTGVEVTPDGSDTAVVLTVPFDTNASLKTRLAAIGRALPAQPEWAFIRAVVAPSSVSWEASGGLISNSMYYQEQVNLADGCSAVQAQLGIISSGLNALDGAAANDQEAQLKRALLKTAQEGWQRTLTQGRASYRAGSAELGVEPCASRTLTWSEAPLRIEFLIVVAVIVAVASGLALLLMWRLSRPRQPRRKLVDKI